MIKLYDKNFLKIEYDIFKFPCGESHVRIDKPLNDSIIIKFHWESNDDLINLLLINDAIRNRVDIKPYIKLFIGYFPYGRQDRVSEFGEPNSVRIPCQLINSCNFDRVVIDDPHSDVIPAMLNSVTVRTQWDLLHQGLCASDKYDALVSPDAGSIKKVTNIIKKGSSLGYNWDLIKADKTRDTKTGAITSFDVYCDDLTGKSVAIVDDICDGGGTFIGLAKELKNRGAERVDLFVSHGMFTKGVDILFSYIDTVFCYNYYGKPEDHIKVFVL